MSERRQIVVDGYNLILRSPVLKPGPDRTLREAREKLVNLLSWAVGTGDAHFIVVFDGSEARGEDEGSGRVEVRFSRPPRTADDVIRALVEELIGRDDRVTVVTSDLEVARHARAMGADIALGDLFLSSIVTPRESEAPEKPGAALSRKELEEWAALFRGGKPQPDEDAD
ncbi:MAG TPA: NYN domain-containing protein [Candidatus Eisenbacteria bacterium]|nr:NYN domain-containing protein [Candidatus Eisenbacteria bacterium]